MNAPFVAQTGMPCHRCGTPLEVGDIRCAICALPAPAELSTHSSTVTDILRCDDCGAAIEYDVAVQAPRCAFCRGIAHIERSEDPPERAELFLPFLVDSERAKQALERWLSSLGWFRPADLSSQATLDSLKPLWWGAWIFDCTALVSWTADSEVGAWQSSWAPHSGQVQFSFASVLLSASRGLTARETTKLAPRYNEQSASPAPQHIDGAVMERFDAQRSMARAMITSTVRQLCHQQARQVVPGRQQRNLRVEPLVQRLITRRCALPAYVLAYRYRGKLYRAVIHGQDDNLVIAEAPYSLLKIVLTVALVVGVLAVVGVLVEVFSH